MPQTTPRQKTPNKIKAATNKKGEQIGCSVGMSFPCGAACFGMGRECSKTLNQQAAQAAQDLMDMLSSPSKGSSNTNTKPLTSKPNNPKSQQKSTKPASGQQSPKVSSTPTATTPKTPTNPPKALDRPPAPPKPEPPSKQREPNELEQKWHTTVFKDSPQLLKDVVAKTGAPRPLRDDEIPPSQKNISHYSRNNSAMHMSPAYKPGHIRGNTVYRHEFGHFLDHQASLKARERLAKELGINLERITIDNVRGGNEQVLKEAGKLKDNTGGEGLQGAAGYGFISSSKEGKKAFKSDEEYLIQRKAETNQRYLLAAKKAGLATGSSEEAIAKGKELVEAEIIKTAKKRNQKVYQLAEDYFKKNPGIHADAYAAFKNRIEKEAKDKGIDPDKLMNAKNQALPIVGLMRSAIAKDDEILIKFADNLIEQGGYKLGGDIAGSITANKVGKGHNDDYYKKGGDSSKNTEAFANIVAGYGYGENSFWNKYAKHLSPNGHAFAMKALESLKD